MDRRAAEEGFTIGDFEVAREVAQIIAIVVIVLGVVVSLTAALIEWITRSGDTAFGRFKRYIARGLLIGIDLLIAGDLIKTVTLEGTLESAAVLGLLGLLVLIRTFLSWSLTLEVEGRWPWQPEHPPLIRPDRSADPALTRQMSATRQARSATT